jgi:DNA-binding NarL/FixJ family response regulator
VTQRIRIIVADDRPTVHRVLALVLNSHADFEVVGEAEDGMAVVEMAARLRPDVVVMDFDMPRQTGDEATRQVLAACPEAKVIGYVWSGGRSVEAMLQAGACCVVVKDGATSPLFDAIRRAAHA